MSFDHLESLLQILNTTFKLDYAVESRIHRLASYSNPEVNCFVKRDDELSCTISGSKLRKYCSLIPFFQKEHVKKVLVIGGAYSNHILGLSQLLIENQINSYYFLKGQLERKKEGNALFSALLIPPENIQWLSNDEWKKVEKYAEHYASTKSYKTFILPEGGSVEAALPGILTLLIDILRNEKVNCIEFDHIFIDAGTGITAGILITALNWIQKKTMTHVVIMAEDKTIFQQKLLFYRDMFCQLIKTEDFTIKNFELYLPQSLKKFGQTNQTLFEYIIKFARKEGFLLDPIYSAKLFLEAQRIIEEKKLKGNILIIHSGGAFSLSGFTNQLGNVLKNL